MADRSSSGAMWRVVFLLIAFAGVIGLIVWMQRKAAPEVAETPATAPTPSVSSWETELLASVARASTSEPPAPVRNTVRDKARRDEIRRSIYRAYGYDEPPAPSAPRPRGTSPERPLGAEAGTLSPEYIQERIRDDFVPLAKQCYEAALERDPKLAGKLVFSFVIVGDEAVGGIVESAEVDEKSDIREEELVTCLSESLLSVSFEPPQGGGSVSVTYPFVFSPGDAG